VPARSPAQRRVRYAAGEFAGPGRVDKLVIRASPYVHRHLDVLGREAPRAAAYCPPRTSPSQLNPARRGGWRGGGHVETAGQPAVHVEYHETVRVAVLCVTPPPPVAQPDHVVGLIGDVFGQ
jgi:hypothetical protein